MNVKVGDLVEYHDSQVPHVMGIGHIEDPLMGLTGVVSEIKHWVDKGAPDRNFGTDIYVLWGDGTYSCHGEWELRLIS